MVLGHYEKLATDVEDGEPDDGPHNTPAPSRSTSRAAVAVKTCAILTIWLSFGWLLWSYSQMRYRASPGDGTPLAHTRNGTYAGIYDSRHDQYYYLGMPYAMPPVASRRFSRPQPLNNSWDEVRNAREYGPMCIGYKVRQCY